MASLREDLETTRKGYQEEGIWHRFLLDSYTGCGGFQGRIQQPPSGYWGHAAAAYTMFSLDFTMTDYAAAERNSYLDRFPREDIDKYLRRVNVAHYLNYCAPITNLKVSYIVRKPVNRQGVPKKLADWIKATNYDSEYRQRAIAAMVLGWFPLVVDMPATPAEAETLAQAEEQTGGAIEPYVVQLLPSHLRDFALDEHGEFLWAKVAEVNEVKEGWRNECKRITRYTIWTRTDFEVYEVEGDQDPPPQPVRRGTHPFGRVPVVSWRAGTSIKDDVKARSTIGDIALEGRRLFNLISELDEHIRSQVFAILLVPRPPQSTGNEKITVGNKGGLQVDPDQKNLPQYLAPPATVAETLETRAEKSVIEIYRMARVEYDRASGTNSSAQSKQQNFEQTNADLCEIAAALAQSDYETLYTVGIGLGCDPVKGEADGGLADMAVVPYASYATEDLSLELEQAVETITSLPMIGVTAKSELLKRLVRQLLPNMPPELQKTVDSEIDEAVVQAQKDDEAAAEAAQAAARENDKGGDGKSQDGAPPSDDEEGGDKGEAA